MCGSVLTQLAREVPKALSIVASGHVRAICRCFQRRRFQACCRVRARRACQPKTPMLRRVATALKWRPSRRGDPRGYDSIVSMEADGLRFPQPCQACIERSMLFRFWAYRLDVVPGDHALDFYVCRRAWPGRPHGPFLGEEASTSRLWLLASAPIAARYLCSSMLKASLRLRLLSGIAQAIDATNSWAIRL